MNLESCSCELQKGGSRIITVFPVFLKYVLCPLPLGIKIELYFNRAFIMLSPFTCAYYLQFMCYYDLHQCENSYRALEQLVYFAKHAAATKDNEDMTQCDLNIAGHCLSMAGKKVEARDMFYLSYTLSESFRIEHAHNSMVP